MKFINNNINNNKLKVNRYKNQLQENSQLKENTRFHEIQGKEINKLHEIPMYLFNSLFLFIQVSFL